MRNKIHIISNLYFQYLKESQIILKTATTTKSISQDFKKDNEKNDPIVDDPFIDKWISIRKINRKY